MKQILYLILILLGIALDQTLKVIAGTLPQPSAGVSYFLHLQYVENTAVLSKIYFNQIVYVLVYILVFLCGSILYKKRKELYIPLALALAGTVSNLSDRIRLGFVIDYISISDIVTFNLADAYIIFGCVLIIMYVITNRHTMQ